MGHGQGSVYRRKSDGRWCWAVTLEEGRRVGYTATKPEAERALRIALGEKEAGTLRAGAQVTTGAFLERWIETQRTKVRARTWTSYAGIVKNHLIPSVGRIPLERLRPSDVEEMLAIKQTRPRTAHPKRPGEAGQQLQPLSPRMAQYVRAVLRKALRAAIKDGLVARNVAAETEPPKVERFEAHPLTSDESRRLLEAAAGDTLEACYRLALQLGLRQGEVLGLRWEDVDLDAGVVHVRRQLQRIDGRLMLVDLKTKASRRSLPLPASVSAALHSQRDRQAAAGIAALPTAFVFTSPSGQPVDPRNTLARFQRLLQRAGLPRRRFHDLRHTFGTQLAASGTVQPRDLMELMGHSQISVTMGYYVTSLPESRRRAIDQLEAVLNG